MNVDKVIIGRKFRFKSKYDEYSYFWYVKSITYKNNNDITYFFGDNDVAYNSSEVEWIDDIREDILNKLGL